MLMIDNLEIVIDCFGNQVNLSNDAWIQNTFQWCDCMYAIEAEYYKLGIML